jgi:lipopolysaccharide assembly outer membrane protein LptD (OstA)
VAEISAELSAATGTNPDNIVGEMRNAQATLYQDGKPSATLTADRVLPDTRKRTITARGNARVQSLNAADGIPSSLRADSLVWDYDRNNITGRGDVVYTKQDVITIPATYFNGDTSLLKYELQNESDSPVIGKF